MSLKATINFPTVVAHGMLVKMGKIPPFQGGDESSILSHPICREEQWKFARFIPLRLQVRVLSLLLKQQCFILFIIFLCSGIQTAIIYPFVMTTVTVGIWAIGVSVSTREFDSRKPRSTRGLPVSS